MFIRQVFTNILLFLSSVVGIICNRRSVLIVLMCVELVLLSVNLTFIVFSVYLDDFCGQIISIFILTIAAAESAIGLAILILFYNVRGNISMHGITLLKG